MKRLSVFIYILLVYSCANKEQVKEQEQLSINEAEVFNDTVLSANVINEPEIRRDTENTITIDENYYRRALRSVKAPISDTKKYHLETFTRQKNGEDQFTYYLLREPTLNEKFKTCLIAEDYESEWACWLVNYTPDGKFIDALEVLYDNAEGAWQTNTLIDMYKPMIYITKYDAYATPETSQEQIIIAPNGKFEKR